MSSNEMQPSSQLVALVALFSITLIRLPQLSGHTPERLAALLPFVLCLGHAGVRRVRGAMRPGTALLVGAYTLLLSIALYRGALVGAVTSKKNAIVDGTSFLVVAWFAVWLITSARTDEERWWRLVAVAFSPAALMFTNLLLVSVGQGVPGGAQSISVHDQAQLLGFIGIHHTREQFPLSQSINNYGVVMAAGYAAALTLWLTVRTPPRWVSGIATALCLYGVLMSDTRSSFLVATLTVLVVVGLPKVRLSPLLAVAVPFSPLIIYTILHGLTGSSLVGTFSRSSGDLLTGTGRLFVWEGAWKVLGHFPPESLIGWGAGGQATSGASLHYAFLFGALGNPFSAHVHNLSLQAIFEIGYVGLAILVALVVSTAMTLENVRRLSPRSPAPALLAGMVALLLGGSTEVTPSLVAREALVFVLVLTGACAGLRGPLVEPVYEEVEEVNPLLARLARFERRIPLLRLPSREPT